MSDITRETPPMPTHKALDIFNGMIFGKQSFERFSQEEREAISVAIKALEEKADREKADGCTGCAYFNVELWEVPCRNCRRNTMDYWRWPKE